MNEIQLLSVGYIVFMVLIGGVCPLPMAWRWSLPAGSSWSMSAMDRCFRWPTASPSCWCSPLFVLAQYALFELPIDTVWGWVVGLLAYDFATYWRHRHHRVHALGRAWRASRRRGLQLRGSASAGAVPKHHGLLWMAPLALDALEMFVGLVVFDYLYQFVQLPVCAQARADQWVFNTPSHHRVHHGRQAAYIDKNYGGILIIWDCLFGTFKKSTSRQTSASPCRPTRSTRSGATSSCGATWPGEPADARVLEQAQARAAGGPSRSPAPCRAGCRRCSKTPTFPRPACATQPLRS